VQKLRKRGANLHSPTRLQGVMLSQEQGQLKYLLTGINDRSVNTSPFIGLSVRNVHLNDVLYYSSVSCIVFIYSLLNNAFTNANYTASSLINWKGCGMKQK
jgi:hypothetical protein